MGVICDEGGVTDVGLLCYSGGGGGVGGVPVTAVGIFAHGLAASGYFQRQQGQLDGL